MRMPRIIAILLGVWLLCVTTTGGAALKGSVFLRENASYCLTPLPFPEAQLAEALGELRRVMQKAGLKEAADGKTALRIILEKAEMPGQPAGSFRFRVTPQEGVRISAADAEGMRCGIMHLLEELGVRFFRPDAPPMDNMVLPHSLRECDITSSPDFAYRGLHICGVPAHYDEAVAGWMSRLKMNRKLAHLGEVDVVGADLARQGLEPDTTAHAYAAIIPDKLYFEEHPEYFSLVGGRRIRHKDGGQLCLSNRAMREEFIGNVGRYIEAHPGLRIVGIPPNDGYGWCECEACRALDTPEDRAKGSVNGRVADFVADMAGRIKRAYPQVLVGHYSYSNFADFLFAGREMPDNLMLAYTVGGRCHRHSLGDDACPINRPLFARLKAYREKVKHVYVYDYYTHPWGLLPAPIWGTVLQDFRDYRAIDIDGFHTEVSGASVDAWKSWHLSIYAAARGLWDADTDAEALLKDYCRQNFGPAAGEMENYFKALQRGLEGMDGCFTKAPEDFERLFHPKTAAECAAWLKKGLARVRQQKPWRQRMDEQRALYDNWVRIGQERKLYGRLTSLPARTLAEVKARGPLREDKETLLLVNGITRIAPTQNRTLVRAWSEREDIGLSILCREENMDGLKLQSANPWGNDNVEIFLAVSREAGRVWQIIADPGSRAVAAECDNALRRWNWAWPGRYRILSGRDGEGWTVDFRINRAEIGLKPEDPFYFIVIRNRRVKGNEITLPTGTRAYRDPRSYIEVKP